MTSEGAAGGVVAAFPGLGGGETALEAAEEGAGVERGGGDTARFAEATPGLGATT